MPSNLKMAPKPPEPSALAARRGVEVGYLAFLESTDCGKVKRLKEWTVERAIVDPRRVVEAALRRGVSGFVPANNQQVEKVLPFEQHRTPARALALGSAAPPQIKFIGHFVVATAAWVRVQREELL
jgi:hypothetical protein